MAPDTIVAHVAANVHCNAITKNVLLSNYQLKYTNLEKEKCILLRRKINNQEVIKTNVGSTTAKCKSITTADEGPSSLKERMKRVRQLESKYYQSTNQQSF